MSSGELDRGDRVALAIAVVMAVMFGGFMVCYLAFALLCAGQGRPLRRLGRAVRAALMSKAPVDADEEPPCESYSPFGDLEGMVEFYRAQADSCLAAGDTAMAASYLDATGYSLRGTNNTDSALFFHRRAQGLRELAGMDPLLRASGRITIAGTFASLGMHDSALAEYLAVHEVCAESGDQDLSSWGAGWLRICLEELGEERFLEVCQEAGRDADEAAGLLGLARKAEPPTSG